MYAVLKDLSLSYIKNIYNQVRLNNMIIKKI